MGESAPIRRRKAALSLRELTEVRSSATGCPKGEQREAKELAIRQAQPFKNSEPFLSAQAPRLIWRSERGLCFAYHDALTTADAR
ncbi:MAG: hypothetical protein CJBNEKGG_03350 [Prosthecobacter sp.]|nr:hypothetical protein [Prosthecobacter sp.]